MFHNLLPLCLLHPLPKGSCWHWGSVVASSPARAPTVGLEGSSSGAMLDKMCRVSSCVWGCAWGRVVGMWGSTAQLIGGSCPVPASRMSFPMPLWNTLSTSADIFYTNLLISSLIFYCQNSSQEGCHSAGWKGKQVVGCRSRASGVLCALDVSYCLLSMGPCATNKGFLMVLAGAWHQCLASRTEPRQGGRRFKLCMR